MAAAAAAADEPEDRIVHVGDHYHAYKSHLGCLQDGAYLTRNIVNCITERWSNATSDLVPIKVGTSPCVHCADADAYNLIRSDLNAAVTRMWGVKLLATSYILFPILEESHWRLIVAYRPFCQRGRCFYVLNSLPSEGIHARDDMDKCDAIRFFLNYYLQRTAPAGTSRSIHQFDITEANTPVHDIKVPTQAHDGDSGIYMLEFMRRIMLACATQELTFSAMQVLLYQPFAAEDVSLLRDHIHRQLITLK